MGQYFKPFNLDKKEFIRPHKLDSGLKLWEICANKGVGQALCILLAVHKEKRGGGDLEITESSAKVIGRWAGDRVVLAGDYAEDSDFPQFEEFSQVYGRQDFVDITNMVLEVMAKEQIT